MDSETDAEALTQQIRTEGINTKGFKLEFKDMRITRLKSKIFYIKKLSRNRPLSKRTFNGKRESHLESIKELLANVYISDSIIMLFTLRNIVNQKALRNPLDRIRTHTANVNRYELAYFLKSLFKKKRLDDLSWSLYKLRFQPKKKKDH
jgi:hypothetical protein